MGVDVQEAGAAEPNPTRMRDHLKGHKLGQHAWRMHAMEAGIGSRGPFVLDLHGLSKAAAGLAIQNVSFVWCWLLMCLSSVVRNLPAYL